MNFDRKRSILWIALVIIAQLAFSQWTELEEELPKSEKAAVQAGSLEDFDFIFIQDFEDTPIGVYDFDQWEKDWNYPSWGDGDEKTVISKYDMGGRISNMMRWEFPYGVWGTEDEGYYGWRPPLNDSYEEVYLTFSVLMRPWFDPVKGGKMMGLQGGRQVNSGEQPEWTDGFAGSLVFKGGPKLNFYVYHFDKPTVYGESFAWEHKFDVSTDIWYDITYRVVMNTATAADASGPDGLKDGILEGFENDVLVGQVTDLRLRNLASIGIDKMRIQGFFGGTGDEYQPSRDEWWLIDNVMVWKYSDEYLADNPSVKRGRQANSMGDEIYTPIDLLYGNVLPDPDPDPGPDEQPPSTPESLQAIDSTYESISLEWDISSDNEAVVGYKVFVDEFVSGSTGENTYKVTGLDPSTEYSFSVSAFDQASNESPKTSGVFATTKTLTVDTSNPTIPANLSIDRILGSLVEVSWDASSDDIGVNGYEVFFNGTLKTTTPDTYATVSRLDPNTTYTITVRAFDGAGNLSPFSNEVLATTDDRDSEDPSAPTGLTVIEVSERTMSLQWNPSTDNVGIAGYSIYVNQVEWEKSSNTNEIIGGLEPGIEYEITVTAWDAAENESLNSNLITVNTKNNDLTTQPRLPEISILEVQDKSIKPQSVSNISSMGFVEIKTFGLEVTEPENPGKESLILTDKARVQVANNDRVTDGLIAFYNFSNGDGSVVKDLSGVNPPVDLNIGKQELSTEWLVGQGLRISESTSITAPGGSSRILESLSATNEITLEAWVKQEKINQSGPARIITLSSGNSTRAVTLAHNGNEAFYNYSARLNTGGDVNGIPELLTNLNFTSPSLHHIVYTRNTQGIETIYINGMEIATGLKEGDFSSWDSDYQLVLGNETTGERPWEGIFYLVSVYDKALSAENVNKNYLAGFGQIEFITELDTLSNNIGYRLKPFIKTNQGLVYGQMRDFLAQNITEQDSLMAFFPNPNNGEFTVLIRNRDENTKTGYLRLIDFSGAVHFAKEIDLSEGLFEKRVNIDLPNSLASGFYALMFITGSRTVAEKLILMQ